MTSFGRIKGGVVNIISPKAVFVILLLRSNHGKNRNSFKNSQGHILSHNQTFLYCRLSKIAKYIIIDDLLRVCVSAQASRHLDTQH